MHVKDDGRAKLTRAYNSGVEIVNFEPEQDAISDPGRRIAHRAVMVIDVPGVQLKNQAV